jgi:hypothetical protein
MCYQVVERYSVCRCLYYKHAIDPCAAGGQRGHVVQEKTVLVAYACALHSSDRDPPAFSQDIVNAFEDSDDSSDDDGSIFSSKITVSRATSFIAVDNSDAIDEILHVLVNDPLLRWDNLLHQTSDDTKDKDVRFFLRAYELSLRAAADSNIERHTCAFLQSRLRYLSSTICKHFHLHESQNLDHDDAGTMNDVRELHEVAIDEPDPALMPSFSRVRSFLFEGVAFEALKGNLRDFGRNKRDYLEEVIEIVLQNIHPPTRDFAQLAYVKRWSLGNFSEALNILAATFVRQLADEAIECNLSASDRIGIRKLAECGGIAQIHTRLIKLWNSDVPPWHLYPLIPGDGNDLGCFRSESNLEAQRDSDFEVFKIFVCSSRALLDFANACLEPFQKSRVAVSPIMPEDCLCTEATVRRTKIKFTCVSLNTFHLHHKRQILTRCQPCGSEITDSYDSSMHIDQRLKQLQILSLQQIYQHAASQSTGKPTFGASIRNIVAEFSWSKISKPTQLPFHQQRFNAGPGTDLGGSCDSQTNTAQHHHNFIHFCIPSTRYATYMSPLQACLMRSDIAFFKALQALYKQSTAHYKRVLSFKKPIALRFVKFRLYDRLLVDIHEIDAIPPESEKHEYDYSPMPADTIPPIGPNLLMHFFLHPDHAAMKPILLSNIPKRKKDRLEPCPIAGSSMGWGIDVITGLNQFKLFGLCFLGAFASIAFGLAWAIVKRDIQGGFAVAGFMLTLAVTATGSLRALDL